MEQKSLEYIDATYHVVFEVSQANMRMQYGYEVDHLAARRAHGRPVDDKAETREALIESTRAMYLIHLYPALKNCVKKLEDKDPEKAPFPEFTEESYDEIPSALMEELQEVVFTLNPHWNPFFVRGKQTGSS